MQLNEIKQAVNRGNFSTTELQSLISYTRTVMETQTKATLNVGDNVFVVQKKKKIAKLCITKSKSSVKFL